MDTNTREILQDFIEYLEGLRRKSRERNVQEDIDGKIESIQREISEGRQEDES